MIKLFTKLSVAVLALSSAVGMYGLDYEDLYDMVHLPTVNVEHDKDETAIEFLVKELDVKKEDIKADFNKEEEKVIVTFPYDGGIATIEVDTEEIKIMERKYLVKELKYSNGTMIESEQLPIGKWIKGTLPCLLDLRSADVHYDDGAKLLTITLKIMPTTLSIPVR